MAVTGETKAILDVLGTGATVEMAERVKAWVDDLRIPDSPPPPPPPPPPAQAPPPPAQVREVGLQPGNLLGLAELAEHLGQPKKAVAAWAGRGLHSFPNPVVVLEATKIWDREQIDVWASGHDDLLH